MKFWITHDDRDAEVEFRAEGGTLWLEIEGKRLEADFHRLPDGEVYSLLVDGRSYEVRISPSGERLEVTLHGATIPVEVRHPLEKLLLSTQRAAGAGGDEVVAAPMPGLVVAIQVKPGDAVEPGQGVVVVEAMKMQNELVSRRGGVVGEVLVAERATVSAGQPLLKIRAAAR